MQKLVIRDMTNAMRIVPTRIGRQRELFYSGGLHFHHFFFWNERFLPMTETQKCVTINIMSMKKWKILLLNVALSESIVNALWFRLKHHLETFLERVCSSANKSL